MPVHLVSPPKCALTAFVDLDHPLFESFDDEPEDLVLMALSQMLVVRAKAAVPLAAVYADLKQRYLAQRAINAGALQAEANQLLGDIQSRKLAAEGRDLLERRKLDEDQLVCSNLRQRAAGCAVV